MPGAGVDDDEEETAAKTDAGDPTPEEESEVVEERKVPKAPVGMRNREERAAMRRKMEAFQSASSAGKSRAALKAPPGLMLQVGEGNGKEYTRQPSSLRGPSTGGKKKERPNITIRT